MGLWMRGVEVLKILGEMSKKCLKRFRQAMGSRVQNFFSQSRSLDCCVDARDLCNSYHLIKRRFFGNSRYGFVVYADPAVTDLACAGLNGMRMAERTLTVRRATEVVAHWPVLI